MKFSDLEADSQIDVPRDAGSQIKEIARQFPLGFRFIVDYLGAKDRLVFRPIDGIDVGMLMAWFDGRRFVALQLERIVATPMEEPIPPEPRPRTMTERAIRRDHKSQQQIG